jgi:hypothetical protein
MTATCSTIYQQFELTIRGYSTIKTARLFYLGEKGLLTTIHKEPNFKVYEIYALAVAPFVFIVSKTVRRM